MSSVGTANYRATWKSQNDQPTLVSLFDKDGKAIFENMPEENLPNLLPTLDEEARNLLKNSRLNAGGLQIRGGVGAN